MRITKEVALSHGLKGVGIDWFFRNINEPLVLVDGKYRATNYEDYQELWQDIRTREIAEVIAGTIISGKDAARSRVFASGSKYAILAALQCGLIAFKEFVTTLKTLDASIFGTRDSPIHLVIADGYDKTGVIGIDQNHRTSEEHVEFVKHITNYYNMPCGHVVFDTGS